MEGGLDREVGRREEEGKGWEGGMGGRERGMDGQG